MAPAAFQRPGCRPVIPQRAVPPPVKPPPERLPGLPVIAQQRTDIVKLVGRDDQFHLVGQVRDPANIRLFARAPGPLRHHETVAAGPHIGGHVGAQALLDGLEGRLPALVLGCIVQQGGGVCSKLGDIRPLAAAYLKGEPVEGEIAVVTREQAAEADYNLSPGRWVSQADEIAQRPIKDIIAELLKLDNQTRDIDASLAKMLVRL